MVSFFLADNARIAPDVVRSFHLQLSAIGTQKALDLWIRSLGGRTEVPWRIIQMVREHCDELGVLVTDIAASAATHLALGANEIVMTRAAALGPVDPAVEHLLLPWAKSPETGDEIPVQVSVQDLKHAVEFVKREAGDQGLSGDGYARVVAALFDKVHPLAVGAIEQTYSLSKLITRRMLGTHLDESADAERINQIADALCDDFKSHNFPIGRTEAKQLGLPVTDAPDDLDQAMWELTTYYESINRDLSPVPATASPPIGRPGLLFQSLGHLDSTDQRIDCIGYSSPRQGGGTNNEGAEWRRVGP